LLSTQAPNEEKDEIAKEEFYSSLEKLCVAVPNYDMKTVLGDVNAKFGKEPYLYPACGRHSLQNKINDNGKLMVNTELGKNLSVTGTRYEHKDIHNFIWGVT
jgi:hypothetical protein